MCANIVCLWHFDVGNCDKDRLWSNLMLSLVTTTLHVRADDPGDLGHVKDKRHSRRFGGVHSKPPLKSHLEFRRFQV